MLWFHIVLTRGNLDLIADANSVKLQEVKIIIHYIGIDGSSGIGRKKEKEEGKGGNTWIKS